MNENSRRGKDKIDKVKYSFETPVSIPANEITERVTTDIVVVGAGTGGAVAGAVAAMSGSKTILLNKDLVQAGPRAFLYGFVNSKSQIAAGNVTDVEAKVYDDYIASHGCAEIPILRALHENSGKVWDLYEEVAADQGATLKAVPGGGAGWVEGLEVATSRNYGYYDMLRNYGVKFGMEYRGATRAVQLIRPNNKGRVTGVIAKKPDGTYVQFNVNKAVILASGDFGGDPEMLQAYAPWLLGALSLYFPGNNTGDMHKACMWIGALMQDWPYQSIIHFNCTNLKPPINHNQVFETGIIRQTAGAKKTTAPINPRAGTQSGQLLYVNKHGRRFTNEYGAQEKDSFVAMEHFAGGVFAQPDKTCWAVFCESDVIDKDRLNEKLKTGEVLTANTIEELATKFGADPDIFRATVDRYNGFVDSGKDLDYGKNALNMSPIKTPPYYVCEQPPCLLNTTGGPRVNANAQVLDKVTWEPIPGLYAIGLMMGIRLRDPALFHSSLDGPVPPTFGYIAAQHAAALTFKD